MKGLCVLLIVLICHSAHTVGMGCVEGESEFHMKDRIRHCVDNNLTDMCTIDWTTINAVTACSRLTVSPSTVTSCTLIITKTRFTSIQSTMTVTSTESVSQCPSTSETTPSITSQQQLQTTNSVLRSTTSLSRLSTSDMRSIHQSTVSLSRRPSLTSDMRSMHQSTASLSRPLPTTSDMIRQNPVHTISMATMGAIIGILLLSLVIVIVGWVWTCVIRRRTQGNKDKDKGVPNHVEDDKTINVDENPAYGGVGRNQENKDKGVPNHEEDDKIINVDENTAYGGVKMNQLVLTETALYDTPHV